MIRSMTAYARREIKGEWGSATWEMRSVNQRYLETYFRTNLLNAPEENHTCDCSPNINTEDTEALCTEEAETITIESTTVEGEETSHQCTEDTTYTMY